MNDKIRVIIRKAGAVLLCLVLIVFVFLTGYCVYHQSMLRKERSLIRHLAGEYVRVDGHNMNVYAGGEGDRTIVFLAGAGTPSPVFDFKPLYSRLSDQYRIVVIEKFGYGYSDEYEGERSVDIIVDQHREALRILGTEGPYILAAHSAGGIEAFWWAEHYPDEVEAVIGLDCSVPAQYDHYRTPLNLDAQQPQDEAECIRSMKLYDFLFYRIGLFRLLVPASSLPSLSSDDLTEEEKQQYRALAYAMYCRGSGAAFQRETIMTEHALRCLREYHDCPLPDIPVLFAVSDGTCMKQVMDPEDWIRIHKECAASLSEGQIVCLDCGHYVHAEKPEETAAAVISFLNEHGGGQ